MKKIIKKPIYYKTICNECGCEFSYDYEDIEFDMLVYGYGVKCPNCQYTNEHEEKNFVYRDEINDD